MLNIPNNIQSLIQSQQSGETQANQSIDAFKSTKNDGSEFRNLLASIDQSSSKTNSIDLKDLINLIKNGELSEEVQSELLQNLNSSLKDQLGNKVVVSNGSSLDFIIDSLKSKGANNTVTPFEILEMSASDGELPLETILNDSNINNKKISPEKGPVFIPTEDFVDLKQDSINHIKAKNLVNKDELIAEKNVLDNLISKEIPKAVSTGTSLNNQIQNILNSKNELGNLQKTRTENREINISDILSGNVSSDNSMFGAEKSMIQNVQMNQGNQQVEVSQSQAPVLDMSKISSSNPSEIIKTISNYLEQNQIMNKDSLDLNVSHEELGNFRINVSKNTSDKTGALDLQIITSTKEGHEFFSKHEISLMKNLSQSGVQLSEFKLIAGNSEGSLFAQSDSKNSNSQSNSNSQAAFKHDMEFTQGDTSQGSQRRKELWEQAQKFQRFGA